MCFLFFLSLCVCSAHFTIFLLFLLLLYYAISERNGLKWKETWIIDMQCNLLQSRHKWCHGETEKKWSNEWNRCRSKSKCRKKVVTASRPYRKIQYLFLIFYMCVNNKHCLLLRNHSKKCCFYRTSNMTKMEYMHFSHWLRPEQMQCLNRNFSDIQNL